MELASSLAWLVTQVKYMDNPTSFNYVPYSVTGFTSANSELWQLKMTIELSVGEGFIFWGALITHNLSNNTSGIQNRSVYLRISQTLNFFAADGVK